MGLFDSLSAALFGENGDSENGESEDGEGQSRRDTPTVEAGPIEGERLASTVPSIARARAVDENGPLVTYRGLLGEHRSQEVEVLAPASPDTDVADAFRDRRSAWLDASTTSGVVDVLAVGDDPRPWLATGVEGTRVRELDDPTVRQRLAVVTEIVSAFDDVAAGNGRHWGLTPGDVRVFDPDAPIPPFARADVGEFAAVGDWGLRRAVVRAAGEELPVTPYDAPEQIAPDEFDAPSVMNAHVREDVNVDTEIELEADHADSKPWIDAYRVGAVAYEILAGHPPFDPTDDPADLERAILDDGPTPPSEVNEGLTDTVDSIVAALTETDPAHRPMAGWVADDFEELFEETAVRD